MKTLLPYHGNFQCQTLSAAAPGYGDLALGLSGHHCHDLVVQGSRFEFLKSEPHISDPELETAKEPKP